MFVAPSFRMAVEVSFRLPRNSWESVEWSIPSFMANDRSEY